MDNPARALSGQNAITARKDDSDREVYPLGRDEAETQRLNFQHHVFLTYYDHALLHPSIPKEKLEKVADVATGTGIWMRDVSKLLAGTALESGKKERSYDGFDISPDQFPSTLEHPFRFHVQNILQPFPPEHHNQYDLVQVRFLTAALRADQVRTAVENVLPLLKPGGYIQWVEIFISLPVYFDNFPPAPPEELASSLDFMYDFAVHAGLSLDLPELLSQEFKRAGVRDVKKESWPKPGKEKEKIDVVWEFLMKNVLGLYPAFLRATKKGMVMEDGDIEMEVREKREILRRGWDGGVIPRLPIVMVVGRK